jgi:hypothetical protein
VVIEQMAITKLNDKAVVDFGEVTIAGVEPGKYKSTDSAWTVNDGELVLSGRPYIHCTVQSLVWPARAKRLARLVEDWDWTYSFKDMQARFGPPNGHFDSPRWRADLTPAHYAEVRIRSAEKVLCQPALLVYEKEVRYSDIRRTVAWLLPLQPVDFVEPPSSETYCVAQPNTVFKGFRLICEPVHGPIASVFVDYVQAANLSLFAGDGGISAGVFAPLVSPEFHFPVLTPEQRFTIILKNRGPEPVRLRLSIEGRMLE